MNKHIEYFLEWLRTVPMAISKINWHNGRVLLSQKQNTNWDAEKNARKAGNI